MTTSVNGVSDIIACSPKGKFTAIEVKSPKVKAVGSSTPRKFYQRCKEKKR